MFTKSTLTRINNYDRGEKFSISRICVVTLVSMMRFPNHLKLLFLSIFLASLSTQMYSQIGNGDFEDLTPLPWKIKYNAVMGAYAKPVRMWGIFNKFGHIGPSGGMSGYPESYIFQFFHCAAKPGISPIDTVCRVKFKVLDFSPDAGEIAVVILEHIGGPGMITAKTIPPGAGVYQISIEDCTYSRIAFGLKNAGSPGEPLTGRLQIDSVECFCDSLYYSSPELKPYNMGFPAGPKIEDLPEEAKIGATALHLLNVYPTFSPSSSQNIEFSIRLEDSLGHPAVDSAELTAGIKWNNPDITIATGSTQSTIKAGDYSTTISLSFKNSSQLAITTTFTICVTDGSLTETFATLTVYPPTALDYPTPQVLTQFQPSDTVDAVSSGGRPPLTYSLAPESDPLPAGLSINNSSGQITGVPTSPTSTPLVVKVRATDANTVATQAQISFTVNPSLWISYPTPDTVFLSQTDTIPVSRVGGTTPFAYSIAAGALPSGMTVDSLIGDITGAPTTTGTFQATVNSIDVNQYLASTSVTLVVATQSGIITDTPPGTALKIEVRHYPNPLSNALNIEYKIPQEAFVELTLYDNNGRQLHKLVRQQQSQGSHAIPLDTSNLPAGVYHYKLRIGNQVLSKKLVVVK